MATLTPRDWQDAGYRLVRLEPGGKRPVDRGWQHIESSHELIDRWDREGPYNFGIHMQFSRLAVLDCDTAGAADWVADNFAPACWWQETPSGGRHYPYSDPDGRAPNRINIMGIGLDLRARMSQVVASPSYHREKRRRWEFRGELVPPEELPVLPLDWLKDATRAEVRQVIERPACPEWARRVLFAEYRSVAGRHGDLDLFRAACFLVQRAGLTDAQALALLREWNLTNAEPPWGERRLAYKISEARRLKR